MDIDWEFRKQTTKANHYTLLKDLRAALDTRELKMVDTTIGNRCWRD